jgi:hypothetical protein
MVITGYEVLQWVYVQNETRIEPHLQRAEPDASQTLAGHAKSLWGPSWPHTQRDGFDLALGRPLSPSTCFSEHPWGPLGFVLEHIWPAPNLGYPLSARYSSGRLRERLASGELGTV